VKYLLIFADLDARPWDFQAEECALRAAVDRFNNRRYGETSKVILTNILCFIQIVN